MEVCGLEVYKLGMSGVDVDVGLVLPDFLRSILYTGAFSGCGLTDAVGAVLSPLADEERAQDGGD
jgi:hypothetical protein